MNREVSDDRARGQKTGRVGVRGVKNLESIRQEHIGRLFMLASRLFEHLALTELREAGFKDLRLVHLALIRSLPVEGLRTTEIGERAGMTKQAVGQLAIELETAGYVIRLPDPTDGRAKLVRYAPRGEQLVAIIPRVLLVAERKIEQIVGSGDFIVLRRALKHLLAHSGEEGEGLA